MEKYPTFVKTFEQALTDEVYLTSECELIAIINNQQYVVKVGDNKCKYYKTLKPRKI